MTNLNEQLLPCPFCGADLNEDDADHKDDCYFTACRLYDQDYPSERTAWNRRAPAAAPAPVAAITDHDDLSRKVLHAIYHACQRGGSAEQLHAAIMPDVRAALAAVPAASPAPAPAVLAKAEELDEGAAIRLRLVCEKLGLGKAVPEDPRELWAVAFSALGMVRHEIENLLRAAFAAPIAQPEPVAWCVVSKKGGIHKLAITKEAAERKSKLWREEWPDNGCEVRGLQFASPATATSDADAKDAARYQFLRHADLDAMCAAYWPNSDVPEGEEFDKAVDAALAALGVKGGEVKP